LPPAEQESAAWPRGLLVVVRVGSADVGFQGAARGAFEQRKRELERPVCVTAPKHIRAQ
jgi:hypothetical protein